MGSWASKKKKASHDHETPHDAPRFFFGGGEGRLASGALRLRSTMMSCTDYDDHRMDGATVFAFDPVVPVRQPARELVSRAEFREKVRKKVEEADAATEALGDRDERFGLIDAVVRRLYKGGEERGSAEADTVVDAAVEDVLTASSAVRARRRLVTTPSFRPPLVVASYDAKEGRGGEISTTSRLSWRTE